MASLLGWLGRTAKGVERQVNPFDNGQTYKQQTPVNNQSVGQQAGALARGFVHPFSTFGSAVVHTPQAIYREAQNKPIYDIQKNVFGTTDPTSIRNQILADTATIGLTAAAPSIGRYAGDLASSVLPNTAPRALPNALRLANSTTDRGVANLLTQSALRTPVTASLPTRIAANALANQTLNTGFGVAGQVGSGQKVNIGQAAKQAIPMTGIGVGAELLPHAVKLAQDHSLNEVGAVGRDVNGVGETPLAKSERLHQEKLAKNNLTQNEYTGLHQNVADLERAASQAHSVVNDAVANAPRDAAGKFTPAAQAQLKQLTDNWGKAQEAHLAALNKVRIIDGEKPITVGGKTPTPVSAVGKNVGAGYSRSAEGKLISKIPEAPNLNKGAFSKADRASLGKLIDAESAKTPTPTGVPKQPKFDITQNAKQNPLLNTVQQRHVLPGDATQAHFNADFVAKHEQAVGGKALQAVQKLSPADQELMKSYQTKGASIVDKAENPQALKQALDLTKNYYDLRHAYDHSLGIETPYRQNYLRDLVQRNNPDQNFATTGGNKAPGYTKAKTQVGFTPVAEALQRDINGASFNHAKLTYANGLEEAFPGSISRGSPITGAGGVTQQLQTPYGNELFATKDVAKGINARAPAPVATGALGKYDSANAFLKYAKLSGGAFHAFTETGNFVGQQIMSGKFFTDFPSTAKIAKVFFSDKAMRSEVAKFAENGTLDKARLGGLTWTPSEIKADVSVTPKGNIAKYTGIKALHDATFQRDIPYAKLKTFEQATQGLDPNVPADLVQIRSAAKGANQGYGGINRIADGLTPKQAKVAARGLLATDFTEGKIRTVIAALSKGGPEGKIARQIIAGKALLFAGLATAGGALAGEYQGKNPTQVAENILGNFVNPTFKAGSNTVSFPATHISEFGKPLTPLFKSPTDKFSGIKDYATNRLAAVPSEVNQLINNKDYSGQHIYGKQTVKSGGGNISPAKTAVNIASGVLPIPASQGISAAQGKQGIPATVANIIGLKVRPNTTLQPTSPTTVTSNVAGAKNSPQNTASATAEKKQLETGNPDAVGLRQLANGDYAYVEDGRIKYSQSLKTAQTAIAKDVFSKEPGSYKVIGDKVYRKAADGTVGPPITKTAFDYQIGTATLTGQKNSGDLAGYLATAKTQLDRIQTQLNDPNTDPLEAAKLQNDAYTLQSSIDKYTGYGGFTKPKAAKKASSSALSASFKSAKAPAQPKGVKVTVSKASFKAPTTRKLSVSKIPSSANSRKLA